jgi:hypothetical protein
MQADPIKVFTRLLFIRNVFHLQMDDKNIERQDVINQSEPERADLPASSKLLTGAVK